MSLISVQGLSFQAGTKPLFEGLKFHLEAGDLVGLVGHNGSGKSTLLRLLITDLQPGAGRVVRQRGLKVGLVEQFLPAALEEVAALDAVVDSLDVDRRLVLAWRVESLLDAATRKTLWLRDPRGYHFALPYSQAVTALFSVDELIFRPGDRVGLLGINGSGKSSLIRSMLAAAALDYGRQTSIRFNPNVRIGYFDQELTAFAEGVGTYDWVHQQVNRSEDTIKRALIHWGFPWMERDRSVRVCSGGERARLMLLTFQLNQPNLLIIDEPTNHDQRFIETVATCFWWIHEGKLREIQDVAEEDLLLERLLEVERLLEEDGRRPVRFRSQSCRSIGKLRFNRSRRGSAWREGDASGCTFPASCWASEGLKRRMGRFMAEQSATAGQQKTTGYAWYALIMLFIVYVFNFVDRSIVNILAESIKKDLGLYDWQIGLLGAGLPFAIFYTVLGIYALGIPVGTMLGYLFGGWLMENFSWREAFIMVGLPGIATIISVPFSTTMYLWPDPVIAFWIGAVPSFLGACYLGPTFALAQGMVGPRMRAHELS